MEEEPYLQWDPVDGFNPEEWKGPNAYLEKENFYGDGDKYEYEDYSDYCDYFWALDGDSEHFQGTQVSILNHFDEKNS